MIKIVALDLSLSHTGWAVEIIAGDESHQASGAIMTKLVGMPRLAAIRDAVLEHAAGADVVVIEGYAFGQARGTSQMHSTGELGGVVRLALYEAGILFVDVAPASLKKYATGRGNAKKEEMLAAAIRRLDYDGHDHNISDALWLLAMGVHRYKGISVVPKDHWSGLEKVNWPEIREGRAA